MYAIQQTGAEKLTPLCPECGKTTKSDNHGMFWTCTHGATVGEDMVAMIARVLSNPMKRDTDDMARNIAQAIISNFNVTR